MCSQNKPGQQHHSHVRGFLPLVLFTLGEALTWKSALCFMDALSLFVFYPLDASSTPPNKVSIQTPPNSPWGQNHLSLRLPVKGAVLDGYGLGENK